MRLKIFLKQSFLYPYFLRYKALRQKMMSDESYFTKRHKAIFGYTPDFRNPQTFNEKIILESYLIKIQFIQVSQIN